MAKKRKKGVLKRLAELPRCARCLRSDWIEGPNGMERCGECARGRMLRWLDQRRNDGSSLLHKMR